MLKFEFGILESCKDKQLWKQNRIIDVWNDAFFMFWWSTTEKLEIWKSVLFVWSFLIAKVEFEFICYFYFKLKANMLFFE